MEKFFESVTKDLSREEQDIIKSTYFTDFRSPVYALESIEPLSEKEQKLFDPKSFVSPYLSRQQVYKVRGNLSPVQFNGAVFRAFKDQRGLRSNYYILPSRTLKAVERKRQPEIIYRNLSQMDAEEMESTARKLSEAEMRRSFDLAKGSLVRFLVLKTGEQNFAIVVTGLQLALDHLDMAEVLANLTNLTVFSSSDKKAKAIPAAKAPATGVKSYWQKVLEDLPERPTLPRFINFTNAYIQQAYRAVMPTELMDALAGRAGEDRSMQASLLQMGWGLFLQDVNDSLDTYFLLLSDVQEENGRAALSMIPVRLKCPEEEMVENATERLRKQIALSQPFSCYEGQGLEELLGEQHDLFIHFLNFHALEQEDVCFGISEAGAAYEQVWDAQGLPLGLYFQPGEGRIALTILYNQYSLREAAVAELVERYFLTLQTMLLYMDMPIHTFKKALKKRMKAFLSQSREEMTTDRLMAYLEAIPFFEGLSKDRLQRLANVAKIRTYFDSDQIIMGHDAGQLFFLLDGWIARHMDPGSGWFSLLDVAKEGSLLNETAFLQKCRSRLMGEVMSDQAKVLTLPLPQVMDTLSFSEEFRGRFFQHILQEMEKYQRRWVSD